MVNVRFYSPGDWGPCCANLTSFLEGLETRDENSHRDFHTYVTDLCKNPRHQSMGRLSGLAILGVCFHKLVLGEVSALCASPLGEDN